jgi:hypothetical protein
MVKDAQVLSMETPTCSLTLLSTLPTLIKICQTRPIWALGEWELSSLLTLATDLSEITPEVAS